MNASTSGIASPHGAGGRSSGWNHHVTLLDAVPPNAANESLPFRSTTYEAKFVEPTRLLRGDMYTQDPNEANAHTANLDLSELTLSQLYSMTYTSYIAKLQRTEAAQQSLPPAPPDFDGDTPTNPHDVRKYVAGLAAAFNTNSAAPSPFDMLVLLVEQLSSAIPALHTVPCQNQGGVDLQLPNRPSPLASSVSHHQRQAQHTSTASGLGHEIADNSCSSPTALGDFLSTASQSGAPTPLASGVTGKPPYRSRYPLYMRDTTVGFSAEVQSHGLSLMFALCSGNGEPSSAVSNHAFGTLLKSPAIAQALPPEVVHELLERCRVLSSSVGQDGSGISESHGMVISVVSLAVIQRKNILELLELAHVLEDLTLALRSSIVPYKLPRCQDIVRDFTFGPFQNYNDQLPICAFHEEPVRMPPIVPEDAMAVNRFCVSSAGDIMAIATQSGMFVCDVATGQIVSQKSAEFTDLGSDCWYLQFVENDTCILHTDKAGQTHTLLTRALKIIDSDFTDVPAIPFCEFKGRYVHCPTLPCGSRRSLYHTTNADITLQVNRDWDATDAAVDSPGNSVNLAGGAGAGTAAALSSSQQPLSQENSTVTMAVFAHGDYNGTLIRLHTTEGDLSLSFHGGILKLEHSVQSEPCCHIVGDITAWHLIVARWSSGTWSLTVDHSVRPLAGARTTPIKSVKIQKVSVLQGEGHVSAMACWMGNNPSGEIISTFAATGYLPRGCSAVFHLPMDEGIGFWIKETTSRTAIPLDEVTFFWDSTIMSPLNRRSASADSGRACDRQASVQSAAVAPTCNVSLPYSLFLSCDPLVSKHQVLLVLSAPLDGGEDIVLQMFPPCETTLRDVYHCAQSPVETSYYLAQDETALFSYTPRFFSFSQAKLVTVFQRENILRQREAEQPTASAGENSVDAAAVTVGGHSSIGSTTPTTAPPAMASKHVGTVEWLMNEIYRVMYVEAFELLRVPVETSQICASTLLPVSEMLRISSPTTDAVKLLALLSLGVVSFRRISTTVEEPVLSQVAGDLSRICKQIDNEHPEAIVGKAASELTQVCMRKLLTPAHKAEVLIRADDPKNKDIIVAYASKESIYSVVAHLVVEDPERLLDVCAGLLRCCAAEETRQLQRSTTSTGTARLRAEAAEDRVTPLLVWFSVASVHYLYHVKQLRLITSLLALMLDYAEPRLDSGHADISALSSTAVYSGFLVFVATITRTCPAVVTEEIQPRLVRLHALLSQLPIGQPHGDDGAAGMRADGGPGLGKASQVAVGGAKPPAADGASQRAQKRLSELSAATPFDGSGGGTTLSRVRPALKMSTIPSPPPIGPRLEHNSQVLQTLSFSTRQACDILPNVCWPLWTVEIDARDAVGVTISKDEPSPDVSILVEPPTESGLGSYTRMLTNTATTVKLDGGRVILSGNGKSSFTIVSQYELGIDGEWSHMLRDGLRSLLVTLASQLARLPATVEALSGPLLENGLFPRVLEDHGVKLPLRNAIGVSETSLSAEAVLEYSTTEGMNLVNDLMRSMRGSATQSMRPAIQGLLAVLIHSGFSPQQASEELRMRWLSGEWGNRLQGETRDEFQDALLAFARWLVTSVVPHCCAEDSVGKQGGDEANQRQTDLGQSQHHLSPCLIEVAAAVGPAGQSQPDAANGSTSVGPGPFPPAVYTGAGENRWALLDSPFAASRRSFGLPSVTINSGRAVALPVTPLHTPMANNNNSSHNLARVAESKKSVDRPLPPLSPQKPHSHRASLGSRRSTIRVMGKCHSLEQLRAIIAKGISPSDLERMMASHTEASIGITRGLELLLTLLDIQGSDDRAVFTSAVEVLWNASGENGVGGHITTHVAGAGKSHESKVRTAFHRALRACERRMFDLLPRENISLDKLLSGDAVLGKTGLMLLSVLCHPWDVVDCELLSSSVESKRPAILPYLRQLVNLSTDSVAAAIAEKAPDVHMSRDDVAQQGKQLAMADHASLNLMVPNGFSVTIPSLEIAHSETGISISKMTSESLSLRADECWSLSEKEGAPRVYYFEVTLTAPVSNLVVGLTQSKSNGGFSDKPSKVNDAPFLYSNNGREFEPGFPSFQHKDTIGCGVVPSTRKVFFTLNGVFLSYVGTVNDRYDYVYPILSIDNNETAKVVVNFGSAPFIYDFRRQHPALFVSTTPTWYRLSSTAMLVILYTTARVCEGLVYRRRSGYDLLVKCCETICDCVKRLRSSLTHLSTSDQSSRTKATAKGAVVVSIVEYSILSLLAALRHIARSGVHQSAFSAQLGPTIFETVSVLMGVPLHSVQVTAISFLPELLPLLQGSPAKDANSRVVQTLFEHARSRASEEESISFLPKWEQCDARAMRITHTQRAHMVPGSQRSIVLGSKLPSAGEVSFEVKIIREAMTKGHSLKGGYFIGVAVAGLTPLTPPGNSQSWKAAKPPIVWAMHDTSPQLPHALNPTVKPNNFHRTFCSGETIRVVVNRERQTVSFYREGEFLKELFKDLPADTDIVPFVQLYNEDASVLIGPGRMTAAITSSALLRTVSVDVLRTMLTDPTYQNLVAAHLCNELREEEFPMVTLSLFNSIPDPRNLQLQCSGKEVSVFVRRVIGIRCKFSVGEVPNYDFIQNLRTPSLPWISGSLDVSGVSSAGATYGGSAMNIFSAESSEGALDGVQQCLLGITSALKRKVWPLVTINAVESIEAQARAKLVCSEADAWDALFFTERVSMFERIQEVTHRHVSQLAMSPLVPDGYAFCAARSHPGFSFSRKCCGRLAMVPSGSTATSAPFIAIAEPALPATGVFSIRCQFVRGHQGQILGGGYYFGVCTSSYTWKRKDMNASPPDVWGLHDMDDEPWRLMHLVAERRLPIVCDPKCILVSGDVVRLEIDRFQGTIQAFRKPPGKDEICLGIIYENLPKSQELHLFVHLYNTDAVAVLLPPHDSTLSADGTAAVPLRTTQQMPHFAMYLDNQKKKCDGCAQQHTESALKAQEWYRCNDCVDYNLCHKCFASFTHVHHSFTKMDEYNLAHTTTPPSALTVGMPVVIPGTPMVYLSRHGCEMPSSQLNCVATSTQDDAFAMWGLVFVKSKVSFTVSIDTLNNEELSSTRPMYIGIGAVSSIRSLTTEELIPKCTAANSSILLFCSDPRNRRSLMGSDVTSSGFSRGSTVSIVIDFETGRVTVRRNWITVGSFPLPPRCPLNQHSKLAGFVIFGEAGVTASVLPELQPTMNATVIDVTEKSYTIVRYRNGDTDAVRCVAIDSCRIPVVPISSGKLATGQVGYTFVNKELRQCIVQQYEKDEVTLYLPHDCSMRNVPLAHLLLPLSSASVPDTVFSTQPVCVLSNRGATVRDGFVISRLLIILSCLAEKDTLVSIMQSITSSLLPYLHLLASVSIGNEAPYDFIAEVRAAIARTTHCLRSSTAQQLLAPCTPTLEDGINIETYAAQAGTLVSCFPSWNADADSSRLITTRTLRLLEPVLARHMGNPWRPSSKGDSGARIRATYAEQALKQGEEAAGETSESAGTDGGEALVDPELCIPVKQSGGQPWWMVENGLPCSSVEHTTRLQNAPVFVPMEGEWFGELECQNTHYSVSMVLNARGEGTATLDNPSGTLTDCVVFASHDRYSRAVLIAIVHPHLGTSSASGVPHGDGAADFMKMESKKGGDPANAVAGAVESRKTGRLLLGKPWGTDVKSSAPGAASDFSSLWGELGADARRSEASAEQASTCAAEAEDSREHGGVQPASEESPYERSKAIEDAFQRPPLSRKLHWLLSGFMDSEGQRIIGTLKKTARSGTFTLHSRWKIALAPRQTPDGHIEPLPDGEDFDVPTAQKLDDVASMHRLVVQLARHLLLVHMCKAQDASDDIIKSVIRYHVHPLRHYLITTLHERYSLKFFRIISEATNRILQPDTTPWDAATLSTIVSRCIQLRPEVLTICPSLYFDSMHAVVAAAHQSSVTDRCTTLHNLAQLVTVGRTALKKVRQSNSSALANASSPLLAYLGSSQFAGGKRVFRQLLSALLAWVNQHSQNTVGLTVVREDVAAGVELAMCADPKLVDEIVHSVPLAALRCMVDLAQALKHGTSLPAEVDTGFVDAIHTTEARDTLAGSVASPVARAMAHASASLSSTAANGSSLTTPLAAAGMSMVGDRQAPIVEVLCPFGEYMLGELRVGKITSSIPAPPQGKFYYEVTLPDRMLAPFAVGWGTQKHSDFPSQHVGSDHWSFAYTGSQVTTKNGKEDYRFGQNIVNMVVVGCLLDMTEKLVAWSVNGFVGPMIPIPIPLEGSDAALWPFASIGSCDGMKIALSASQFQFAPDGFTDLTGRSSRVQITQYNKRHRSAISPQPVSFYIQLAAHLTELELAQSSKPRKGTNNPGSSISGVSNLSTELPERTVFHRFRALENLSEPHRQWYMHVVRVAESCMATSRRFINLDSDEVEGTLASSFLFLKQVVTRQFRKRMGEIPALEKNTASLSAVWIRATELYSPHPRTPEVALENTVLSQLYKQIGSYTVKQLLVAPMFKVHLHASTSNFTPQDLGGPYRQVWTLVADEIMMHTDRCYPNTHFHRNPMFRFTNSSKLVCVVPDSLATSNYELALFNFLGKIMGHMSRARTPLALDFSPFVWKFLVEDDLTVKDYYAYVDSVVANSLADEEFFLNGDAEDLIPGFAERILHELDDEPAESCASDGDSERRDSAGSPGAIAQVIMGARYIARRRKIAEDCLVHSMDQQLQALREGLWAVLPKRVTRCISWQDLEQAVCGEANPSLMQMREAIETQLTGNREQFFWRLVEEMNGEQRARFLCFACGQRRLPLVKRIRVVESSNSTDYLPHAQSCGFLVVIPPYTTFEQLTSKVLCALEHQLEMELA